MDQGLAAVWAGIAGLAGGGIGSIIVGGFTVHAARAGGDKAIEAAERAEQRAATAEHQHWQRQQRFDAYVAVLLVAEQPTYWSGHVGRDLAEQFRQDMLRVIARVRIVGPGDVAHSAMLILRQVSEAATVTPPDDPISWDGEDRRETARRFALFMEAGRQVLEQPPT